MTMNNAPLSGIPAVSLSLPSHDETDNGLLSRSQNILELQNGQHAFKITVQHVQQCQVEYL